MLKRVFRVLLLIGLVSFFSFKTKDVFNSSISRELNYIQYYLKVYQADSLYITKNYQKSYEILDKLFKDYEPINLPNYNELFNYYRLKLILKKDINRSKFSELISKYNLNNEILLNDSLMKTYYMKEKFFFDKNYNLLRQKFISKLNLKLRDEIKEMRVQDQLFRDKDYQYNIIKQNKIDSINSLKTRKIFKEFGYPNEYIIGDFMLDKSFVDIEIILLHTKDVEREEYYLPKVLEFIEKGKAPPRTYAVLLDQFNLYHGKEQYYGSYSKKVNISISELNKRRKLIGLPSYGYEKWRFEKLHPNEEY
ncbi:hypothetical protein [Flavobacterium terrae]|uniref:Uncharacterized protein n=1 Tax=Flavobacterium terrae TaxID=415425 RepID=A0A1M6B9S1_9FLAO|nr:hypothetical protein [Flavobacterium terrae]SHI45436.1 hypothetical protein SAMN05444363_0629 [Flavobacterium terrae]